MSTRCEQCGRRPALNDEADDGLALCLECAILNALDEARINEFMEERQAEHNQRN